METAKVDVRKLQLLNDRINQCLDALSQVRLSVHGLSHTQANPTLGGAVPGAGYFGYGMTPIGQTPIGQGYGGGLSHSPFISPVVGAFPQQFSQLNTAGFPQAGFPPAGQFPFWQSGQIPLGNVPGGLSHTGLETEPSYNRPLWADPILAAKVAQTFPYVQFGVPPLVQVY